MRLGNYLAIGLLDGEEGMNFKQIVKEIGYEASWVSKCLTDLETRGLIKKEKPQKKGYRNQVFFYLTDAGMEMKTYFNGVREKLGLSWQECMEYKKW